jgi:hypothetical protein
MVFDDPTAIDAADLASTVDPGIVAFWNTLAAGASSAMAGYLSTGVSRAAAATAINYYKLQDGALHTVVLPEGSPVEVTHFTLNPVTATANMPSEVAICVSFHGSEAGLSEAVGGTGSTHKGGTRPAARVRGRFYLGPFNTTVLAAGTTMSLIPDQVLTDVSKACGALRTACPSWAVWSRKNGSTVIVDGGHVDNEWDTVRRRRDGATARDTF